MNDLGTITLETERLILRKISVNDAEEAFNNWTDDHEVTKYVTWKPHGNVETTKELFKMWEERYKEPHTYKWVVYVKELDSIIGTIDVVHKSIDNKKCEIGYCYGSKFWGKGYATEALKIVINFLLNDVGFELIEAICLVTNPASGKVMEKAGMKYDATLRKRYIDPLTENRVDCMVYSIMKEEKR